MQCTNHAQMEAAGYCVYCGKPFCNDCLVEVDGRMYCRTHITNAMQDARQQAAASPTPAVNIINNNNLNQNAGIVAYPYKNRLLAFILCLFFGAFGVHRFYVGKIGTGLIWLFTFGVFGFGYVIDLLIILLGGFRDKTGMPLV